MFGVPDVTATSASHDLPRLRCHRLRHVDQADTQILGCGLDTDPLGARRFSAMEEHPREVSTPSLLVGLIDGLDAEPGWLLGLDRVVVGAGLSMGDQNKVRPSPVSVALRTASERETNLGARDRGIASPAPFDSTSDLAVEPGMTESLCRSTARRPDYGQRKPVELELPGFSRTSTVQSASSS